MDRATSRVGFSSSLAVEEVLERLTVGTITNLSSQLMKAVRLDGGAVQAADIEGRVLTHDLGPDLRKGTVLGAEHLALLRGHPEVHAVELEPGDIHEDEAGRRLTDAIANLGPLKVAPPAPNQNRLPPPPPAP